MKLYEIKETITNCDSVKAVLFRKLKTAKLLNTGLLLTTLLHFVIQLHAARTIIIPQLFMAQRMTSHFFRCILLLKSTFFRQEIFAKVGNFCNISRFCQK